MKVSIKNQLFHAAETNNAAVLERILGGMSPQELTGALQITQSTSNDVRLLGKAVMAGHREACQTLLKYGANPNAVGYHHGLAVSAMSILLRKLHLTLFDVFIRHIDPNVSEYGTCPLNEAVRMEQFPLAERLIAAKAKVDLVFSSTETEVNSNDIFWLRETAFQYAISKNDFLAADFLLLHGADINAQVDEEKNTSLHRSVRVNNEAAIQYLISKKVDLNRQKKSGLTALHIAVANKLIAAATVLLNAGADMNVKDHGGYSAFEYACSEYDATLFKLLLKHKPILNPEINPTLSFTPLTLALSKDQVEAAKILVCFGANVNITTPGLSLPPLTTAVILNATTLVKLMLDKNADVNVKSPGESLTPITYAMNKADTHIEIITLLLSHPKIEKNGALFDAAAFYGRVDMMKALQTFCLRNNIPYNEKDIKSAMIHSLEKNYPDCVKYLVSLDNSLVNFAYTSLRDMQLWTPLLEAVHLGYKNLVRILLELGAQTHFIPAKDYPVAIQLAARSKNATIVNHLLDHHCYIGPVAKEDSDKYEFVFDLILYRLKKQDVACPAAWIITIIQTLYFEKRDTKRLQAKYFLTDIKYQPIALNRMYIEALANYYQLTQHQSEKSVTLSGNPAVITALCHLLTTQYSKYAEKNSKGNFVVENDKITLSFELLGQASMLSLFLKEDFSQLQVKKIVNKTVSTDVAVVVPRFTSNTSGLLKNKDLQFFRAMCHKLVGNGKSSFSPEFEDDDDHSCPKFNATLNLNSLNQVTSNHYVIAQQKRTAELTIDDINIVCSRLKNLDCSASFSSETHILNIQFHVNSNQSQDDWDRILFNWFEGKFNRKDATLVPALVSGKELPQTIEVPQKSSADTSAIVLLTQFLKKCLPANLAEFSMAWCNEFVFDPPRKNNSKYRFQINRQYHSITINSTIIDPFELIQLIVKKIANLKLCYLNTQNTQQPLLVMKRELLENLNDLVCNKLKPGIVEWLEANKNQGQTSSEQRIIQITPPAVTKEKTLSPTENHAPWLLAALLDKNNANEDVLKNLKLISTKINATPESERSLHYRAYCFYLFCLVNNLYQKKVRHAEVKELRHALRHNAFSQNYKEIYSETQFLAQHSDFILGFAAMNANLDKEMLTQFSRTENYLTQLSQETNLDFADYALRFHAEILYMAALTVHEASKIRNAATAFTACLIYNCLKNLDDFTLVNAQLLDQLQSISTFVGHEYGDHPAPEQALTVRCETLIDEFQTQHDAGLSVRCMQWISGARAI